MSRAASCTLLVRCQHASQIQRVRLSVLGPVANLHVRFQHAYGSLIKASSGTLKRPVVRLSVHNVESSDLYADCTLPGRLSELHQMQVDKAHVAVPNWTKEDFQEARLSDPLYT